MEKVSSSSIEISSIYQFLNFTFPDNEIVGQVFFYNSIASTRSKFFLLVKK